MHTCTHAYMHTLHTCTHCTHVHMHMCTYAQTQHMHTHMHMHMHMHTCTPTHTHTRTRTRIRTRTRTLTITIFIISTAHVQTNSLQDLPTPPLVNSPLFMPHPSLSSHEWSYILGAEEQELETMVSELTAAFPIPASIG